MSWTDERVERLKTLWSEGLSASQIATELGSVTRNAVIGKVHRLGLSGRAKPQVQPTRTPATGSVRPAKAAPARQAAQVETVRSQPARPVSIGATALKSEAAIDAEADLAPAPVVDASTPPVFERVTILNLTESTCKWPVGDPGKPGFFFCGRKTEVGIPYCAYHARLAYQPSSERRRDRKAG